MRRPVAPTDWERFFVHARRVRTFETFSSQRRVALEALQALDIAAESKVLLPNLRQLKWNDRSDDAFPFIRLFLGTHIQDLSLNLDGSPMLRLSLLSTLCSRYPMLGRLTLHGPSFSREDTPQFKRHIAAVSTALCGWHNLRNLTVGRVTSEALVHIATLPKLCELDLHSITLDSPRHFPLPENTLAFPSLQILSLDGRSMQFCVPLIESMSQQLLQYLAITARVGPPSSWKAVCSALSEHCIHDSLQHVELELTSFTGEQVQDYILLLGDIEPLFVFSQLTTIKLVSTFLIGIRDEDMDALARAWPRIRILSFGREIKSTWRPKLTLQGLVPLARHCKELEELEIFLSARRVPPWDRGPEIFAGFSRTLTINVTTSPIRHPKDVAVFLSRIFPNLISLENEDRSSREDDDIPVTELDKKWSEVEDLLEILVAVRTEERERWEAEGEVSEDSEEEEEQDD